MINHLYLQNTAFHSRSFCLLHSFPSPKIFVLQKPSFSSWVFVLLSHGCHTHNTSDARCVGVSPTTCQSLWNQLGVLQCNSFLTFSTWRWRWIPQIEGSIL